MYFILFLLSFSFSEKSISYYANGQIEEEKKYKDGKKNGKWIWYYENGQIKFENNYKDGILNGKMIQQQSLFSHTKIILQKN